MMKTLIAVAAAVAFLGGASHRVGQAGVTLALPHGWSSIPLVLPSAKPEGDPVTRIVVASAPIRFGQCNDVSYTFSPKAVAIVVLEWRRPTPGVSWSPRPRHFVLATHGRIECHVGTGGSVKFEDHGRRFEVFVLLGKRAPAALAARARAVLDTLRVR
jgi:hypothetical protein